MVRSLLILASLLVAMTFSAKLPSNFKTCKVSDPKFKQCLKEAVQDVIPKLANGIPSLGVLPLKPLEISHLEIGEGDGPVKVRLEFNNIRLEGLTTIQIDDIDMDVKNYRLTASVHAPDTVTVSGPYKVDGQVLVLPIKGEGNCNLTFTGLKAQLAINSEALTKNGEKYMKVNQFEVNLEPSHLYIQLENLFNGDKTLGDNMNLFLNENWKEILVELKPGIEAALGASFQEISNRVFSKVPFNQVFLDN